VGSHTLYVQERNAAGNWSSSGSRIIVIDTTAPTASVTTATITNSGNAVVQSTETGTAYLVKTTVSVSNLTSITGAADSQWNSVAISSAATNTNLAATGLANGTYKVYAIDAAGNLSSASSNSVTVDTTAPTAPSVSGTTPTNDTTPDWTWSAGGGGNGTYRYKLDSSDLTSGATETTSTSYTPASAISEASHTLYVQEQDAAGNWSSSGSRAIVIDTTAPSVNTFTLSDTALKVGETATVTLVFSEAVASFASAADITVANGTLATMSSGNNVTWTGTFTPTANTEDASNVLSLATSYTDTAGNAGPAANTLNYAVETQAPSVDTFTLSDTALKVGETATVTLVFSEAVTSFSSADDITVASGTLATMSTSNNVTWTGTFTPTANTEDATNVLSLATSYTDTAGNAGPAEDTSNYAVDTLAPTMVFDPLDGARGGREANITITFSEAVRNESDDSDLDDDNVDSLITLKWPDAGGTDIGFDATINDANTIITINPSARLPTIRNIYVAIGATVEDSADNAITASDATFQTCKNNNALPCGSDL
jgi:hypothetical protein